MRRARFKNARGTKDAVRLAFARFRRGYRRATPPHSRRFRALPLPILRRAAGLRLGFHTATRFAKNLSLYLARRGTGAVTRGHCAFSQRTPYAADVGMRGFVLLLVVFCLAAFARRAACPRQQDYYARIRHSISTYLLAGLSFPFACCLLKISVLYAYPPPIPAVRNTFADIAGTAFGSIPFAALLPALAAHHCAACRYRALLRTNLLSHRFVCFRHPLPYQTL